MAEPPSANLWAVVLAGGEGKRLAPLTRRLYPEALPKQFAVLDGDRSLLQATLDRIGSLVPPGRTLVVVNRERAALARAHIGRCEEVELVIQPRNLGTGPGLLLPLARVLQRGPSALVAVFPSDHHVARPERLLEAVAAAAAAGVSEPVLLGILPDRVESEYGYILPGRHLGRVPGALRRVQRFVEKPAAPLARRLIEEGALWNTFVCVGPVTTFWALARACLPEQTRLFERYLAWDGQLGEDTLLEHLYAQMEPGDFSRDVLERAGRLAVLAVDNPGWSDWGTPQRVLESLSGTPGYWRLLDRLSGVRSGATTPGFRPVERS